MVDDTQLSPTLDSPAESADTFLKDIAAAPFEPPPRAGLEPGTVVDHFRVIRLLGKGGMGEVHLARDLKLGRRVALKVIRRGVFAYGAAERFLQEAQATALFSHPNIVTIYACGEHDGSPYVALEYLEGDHLRDRLRERPLAPAECARYALDIARALMEAHAHGIVHRDLKPENVLLPKDGRLRLLDFGLARAVGPAPEGGSQKEGIAGTPAYMAPEQWALGAIGPPADVWALGVMLHEMLAGCRPYGGDNLALAQAAMSPEALDLRALRASAPDRMCALVERCVAKDPATRPAASECASELDAFLHAGAKPLEEGPFRGLLSFEERHGQLFFGRDAEIAAFLERLRSAPIAAVVGASGAGKSSFVLAGVVPRLRERGAWTVLRMRPGERPFSVLAARLASGEVSGGPASGSELAAELLAAPERLSLALTALAERTRTSVLLVVDQLEEVRTLARDPDHAARFLRALAGAADDRDAPVRVVFTLRDDFLGALAEQDPLLRDVTVMKPPSEAALAEILTRPLEAAGYRWEDPALVTEMLASVRGERACLPLLQFTTQLLWDRRDVASRTLRRADYQAIGGVGGALASHADGVLDAMPEADVRGARAILLRLVTPEGTRRVVPRSRLIEGQPAEVLGKLIAARLLVARKSPGDDESAIELAHESLIQGWQHLARWIEESREGLQVLSEIGQAADLWERRGRRAEELWRGDALHDARRALERTGATPPANVDRFLAAGIEDDARRARRRRMLAGSGLTALALAALVAGGFAIAFDRQRDDAQLRMADAERDGAAMALLTGDPLAARAKLRTALEVHPTLEARALWRRLKDEPLLAKRVLASSALDVGWSPDGRRIAVATLDHAVVLLDPSTLAPTFLRGHREQVLAVAFSPDGGALVSGSADGQVLSWDLATGAHQVLLASGPMVRGLAVHPDRRRVAVASRARAVRILGAGPPRELAVHDGDLWAVAFSPDGERLATAAEDQSVRVWTIEGAEEQRWSNPSEPARRVAFTPDGRRVASAGFDRELRVWDRGEPGAPPLVLAGHAGHVLALAIAPDGRHAATGDTEGAVRLWDLSSPGRSRAIGAHEGRVTGVSFDVQGRYLASSGSDTADRSVRLWDLEARGGDEQRAHEADVLGLAVSPDGRRVASSSGDRTILVRELDSGEVLVRMLGHTGAVVALAWSPDGQRLASGGFDHTVRLWDAASGREIAQLTGHRWVVGDAAFSSDGARLATASWDGTVRLWRFEGAEAPREERVLSAGDPAIASVAFDETGARVAAGLRDGTVRVFDAATGAQLHTLRGHGGQVSEVAFAAGGRLFSSAHDGTLRAWDLASGGSRVLAKRADRLTSIAVDAAGTRAAIAGASGRVELLDLATLETLARFGHRDHVNAVRFAGDRLATASDDLTVRLWDAATGRPVWHAPYATLTHRGWTGPAPAGGEWSAKAAPDAAAADVVGSSACAVSFEGVLSRWDLSRDVVVASASVGSADAVVALAGACAALSGGRVQVLERAPEDLGPASAIARADDGTLLLARTASISRRGGAWLAAGARGITAIASAGDQVVVGLDTGAVHVVGGRAFAGVVSSAVSRLLALPGGAIAVGHEDGTVALFGLARGSLLDRFRLHGPIAHLLAARGTLHMTSALGDTRSIDVSLLTADACEVLAGVWREVPVAWDGGALRRAPPPADHRCGN